MVATQVRRTETGRIAPVGECIPEVGAESGGSTGLEASRLVKSSGHPASLP